MPSQSGPGDPTESPLIVTGIARSKYARSARQYEKRVRDVAKGHFDAPLRNRDLSVEVHHFYTSGNAVDLDNLLKAVLDGLKDGAYEDDSQIVRVTARRYNISESYVLEETQPEWVPLLSGPPSDFVSIRVTRAL